MADPRFLAGAAAPTAANDVKDGRDNQVVDALLAAVARMLTPVVRILLRYGVTISAFENVVRRVFLDVTESDYTLPGRKLSASRIAVLTGLSRYDVAALRASKAGEDPKGEPRINRAARVIAAWRREPDVLNASGLPLALPFEGDGPSFSSLVKRFAGDVPARATLDELLRVGAVERLRDGRIRLIARAYVPKGADTDVIAVLGSHVPDLVESIDHNLTCEPDDKFFQRRVTYRDIPADRRHALRPMVTADAQRLLEKLDTELSAEDRAIHPEIEGEGRIRISLGVYYLEEEIQ